MIASGPGRGLGWFNRARADLAAWWERDMKPAEIAYTIAIGVVGVVATYSAFQTSRLDGAFDSIADIRERTTRTETEVVYLRRDTDKVLVDLDAIKASLASIDGKLASADGAKQPAFAIKDPQDFSDFLRETKAPGQFWIYSDDPGAEKLLKGYFEGQ